MTTAFHALDDVSFEEVRDAMLVCGGELSGDLPRTWGTHRIVSWTFAGGATRVSWCGIFRLGEAVLLVEGDPTPCAPALERLPVLGLDALIAALGPSSTPSQRVRAARRLASVRAPWSAALEAALALGLDDDNAGVRQSFGHAILFAPWRQAEGIVSRAATRWPEIGLVRELLAAEA